MNADELMRRLIEYGADENGIKDRFMGNVELYESCFREFLNEPNLDRLKQALERGDYESAFAAAHALKGLSGNLGVTAFYEALCVLVESLRAKSFGDVEREYAAVERELERLRALAEGRPFAPAPEAPPAPAPRVRKKIKDKLLPVSVAALAAVLLCVGGVLFYIMRNYRENITSESAEHLIEINHQLKLYVEERISGDWKVAHSVGDSVAGGSYGGDEAVFEMLSHRKSIWQTTDIMLYTENGYGVCSDGEVQSNDIASELIARSMEQGEYMTIVDSELIYTVPVETEQKYKDSRIVAVSVVQSMESFLDDMGFSSFEGSAFMYLTEESGIIISRLTNPNAPAAFNFQSIINDCELTAITGEGLDGGSYMSTAEPTAYMMSGRGESEYLVSTPISTSGAPLRLFYLAPARVVNETMDDFSRQLVFLCLFVVLVFAVFAAVLFVAIFRGRKKRFDEALLAREKMFDLLIKNTRTAFGLFSVGAERPDYISSNARAVVGYDYFVLKKANGAYLMQNSEGTDADSLRQLNEEMAAWDGESEFRSGCLLNERASPPNYFEVQLYPAGDEGCFVGIARDVTQSYEREKTTADALEMAERANRAKSRFLSNMSHDIRTPMNAVMNMANFAIDSMDSPVKLREYLQTIRESSEHLRRLINDVLDMSRIESGQTIVESEPFDITAEMKRQADMIRPLCMAKKQTLITDFSAVRTSALLGDQLKISQILGNLLSNAVKFTPERGAVRFTAEEIPSLRAGMVSMRFVVEDNGIGISDEYVGHIFEPFSRADDRRISRIEGTGLGLSICHSYVTAMGGDIRCESEEGEGSVFTVELFFQKAGAPPPESSAPVTAGAVPFAGLRCIVAEDNLPNQTIAKTMLERLGFTVDIVADGWDCLQKLRLSKPGCYDIIYMDIQMPVMDGHQAAVAIRECGHAQAQTIPIVAMTANVFAEDIEKARIAGMDGYLGKPIMSVDIIEETQRAINKRKAAS